MTLKRVNEYFAKWKDHPPVYVLVKGLLEGLGGKPAEDDPVPVNISQFVKEVGSTVPVVHGPDLGLPKTAVVFDIDEMRRRNSAHKIRGPIRG